MNTRFLTGGFAALCLCIATGCASIQAQPQTARKTRIGFANKINPLWWFGNMDDPEPPADYIPGHKLRRLKWAFRNPFHNFDFYVIGVADKGFVRSVKPECRDGEPKNRWTYAVTRYRRWRLPFISFHGKSISWYFGWRDKGNFGISLRKDQKAHKDARVRAP
jgi:hypothetical protein